MNSFICAISVLGLGIEVYVFLIIIGIPVFFIWRWILRKLIHSERKLRFAIWIATIFSTPVIYIGCILLFVLSIEYYPKRNFDQKVWLTNKDERYELSDHLIDSKILIGKTKTDIKKLLGDDGNKDEDSEWYYELGIRPGIGNIDPDGLIISFKNDKVVEVVQRKH